MPKLTIGDQTVDVSQEQRLVLAIEEQGGQHRPSLWREGQLYELPGSRS